MENQVATEPQDHPQNPQKPNGGGQVDEGDGSPTDSIPDTLNLDVLEDTERTWMPGITSRIGAGLKEAAITCLEENRHASGINIEVDGDCTRSMKITWTIDGDVDRRLAISRRKRSLPRFAPC